MLLLPLNVSSQIGILTIRDLITGPNKVKYDPIILEQLLPSVFRFVHHPSSLLKSNALKIVLGLTMDQMPIIKIIAHDIVKDLYYNFSCEDFECVNLILDIGTFICSFAYPEIESLVPKILETNLQVLLTVKNSATVLIATEFFRNMLVHGQGIEHMQPLFKDLVGVLARNTIFSEYEIDVIEVILCTAYICSQKYF